MKQNFFNQIPFRKSLAIGTAVAMTGLAGFELITNINPIMTQERETERNAANEKVNRYILLRMGAPGSVKTITTPPELGSVQYKITDVENTFFRVKHESCSTRVATPLPQRTINFVPPIVYFNVCTYKT